MNAGLNNLRLISMRGVNLGQGTKNKRKTSIHPGAHIEPINRDFDKKTKLSIHPGAHIKSINRDFDKTQN